MDGWRTLYTGGRTIVTVYERRGKTVQQAWVNKISVNKISDFAGRLWYEWGLIFVYDIISKTNDKIVLCHPYSASRSCWGWDRAQKLF